MILTFKFVVKICIAKTNILSKQLERFETGQFSDGGTLLGALNDFLFEYFGRLLEETELTFAVS